MSFASALRQQIEVALADRIPAALSIVPRFDRSVTPTGILALDASLGGFPAAAITELVGLECSGRATTALAYVSSLTRMGSVCAWIDVADTLDPESVTANGIDLERLLWVRCGAPQPASQAVQAHGDEVTLQAALSPSSSGGVDSERTPQSGTSLLHTHRSVSDQQLRREKKTIGTPSAPNRPLTARPSEREEQVNSDRLPARRGDNLAPASRYAELQPGRTTSAPAARRMSPASGLLKPGAPAKPWQAVDQALRATDLLLQGGGFSAIVLDLGSVPPEVIWRIPSATWFRFRAACGRTRVSLLLLTQHPCSRTSAELIVRLQPGSMEAENCVMTGIRYDATTERSRFSESRPLPNRKPPTSERTGQWKSEAAWMRTR